jgi:hypothetical protein
LESERAMTSELELALVNDPVPIHPPGSLWKSDEPEEVVAQASRTAIALADVIRKQKLSTTINGRAHVHVEGWTLLGSLLGVFPVLVWTRKLDDGWEARVEARTLAGNVVGAAEAECLRSEKTWAERADYALRSMAQTRATSKALRQPLGFVITLAGFDATPAEEMPAPAKPQPITDQQRKAIYAIAGRLEKAEIVTAEELEQGMWHHYGTAKVSELTKNDASELIERLEAKEKEAEK